MKSVIAIILLSSFSFQSFASELKELDYDNVRELVLTNKVLDEKNINVLIDVLWDGVDNNDLPEISLYSAYSQLKSFKLNLNQKVRLVYLKSKLFPNINNKGNGVVDALINIIKQRGLDESTALIIAGSDIDYNKVLSRIALNNQLILKRAKSYLSEVKKFVAPSIQEVSSLFLDSPNLDDYQNGEYKDSLRLFMFCRHNRNYPCLLVMKDIFNTPVYNIDNELWSINVLGQSARGFAFNLRNGYTPSGIHTINSVMPEANRMDAFGKFRRLILNFIPKSKNNRETKKFLPAISHNSKWWKEATIARDVGRSLFRIHGTGRVSDRSRPYYPHVPTNGCVSTLEGNYKKEKFQDQRILLDRMMSSSRIAPTFSNETQLKGVLHIIEIDDQDKKVTLEDLKKYQID